jgi:hypothetical protein
MSVVLEVSRRAGAVVIRQLEGTAGSNLLRGFFQATDAVATDGMAGD